MIVSLSKKQEKTIKLSSISEGTSFHFGSMSASFYLKCGDSVLMIPSPDYTSEIKYYEHMSNHGFDIYPPNTVISMVQE